MQRPECAEGQILLGFSFLEAKKFERTTLRCKLAQGVLLGTKLKFIVNLRKFVRLVMWITVWHQQGAASSAASLFS